MWPASLKRYYCRTKESIYRRKEFNSYSIGLGHTHGRRFFVRQDCALRKIEKGGGFCEGELNRGFTVDFLVAQEQKLGATVHLALLEHSHG